MHPAAPTPQVPILIDGDTKLIESGLIVEYLDSKYPQPPLAPADPAATARARLFAEVFASSFTPAMFSVIRSTNRAELAEARDKLVAALKVG